MIKCNIDVTNANVVIPTLALKKEKGVFGQLKFNLLNENTSKFRYTQNDVNVSGVLLHKSIFEIKKVDYSHIKTSEIHIEQATFKKLDEHSEFKLNKGSISLDFLMRLKFKTRSIPLDLIFSNITVTYKKNIFLNSLNGEIRSFEGLRGYIKAKLHCNQILKLALLKVIQLI